jgi:hypothetical protein
MASALPPADAQTLPAALLFEVTFMTYPSLIVGSPLGANRTVTVISGGQFAGPRLCGEVLAGGADWVRVRHDGNLVIDVRATLRTEGGGLIEMTYGGRLISPPAVRAELYDPARNPGLDPAVYSLRTNPLFETGDAGLLWLNDVVAVGYGRFVQGGVRYTVFAI